MPLDTILLLSHSFFFNDTATTEIYTLSLHDALPIYKPVPARLMLNPYPHPLPATGSVCYPNPLPAGLWHPRVHPRAQYPQVVRSEEHTSELQSQSNLVCRLLLEKKK